MDDFPKGAGVNVGDIPVDLFDGQPPIPQPRLCNRYLRAVTILPNACETRVPSILGVDVPATQVHAALLAALVFAYSQVVSATGVMFYGRRYYLGSNYMPMSGNH